MHALRWYAGKNQWREPFYHSQLQKLQRCRQKAAFLALAEGHLDTALDQLVDAEADPRELLALVTDLKPAGFNPDEELRRLLDGKSPALTLDFVERYLRRIRPFAWAKPYVKVSVEY